MRAGGPCGGQARRPFPVCRVEWLPYILLAATGVVAGVLGGLLGIGGSSVMLPAMVWILGETDARGVRQINQYQAAAMIVNFLLILPAVVAHARNRAIWPRLWAYMAAGAGVGILIGVQVSYAIERKYLQWTVGAFFLYVVVHNVDRLVRGQRKEGRSREQVESAPAWAKLAIGLPMGVAAGLLGIGGGSLAVPAQQIGLKVPLRNAIATSAATIAAVSWIGAISKNLQLGQEGTIARSLLLAGCLAPTAMIGSYVGGHLTHALPLRVVRGAFIALMLLAAAKMFGWL